MDGHAAYAVASAPLHAANYSLADANYSLADANHPVADANYTVADVSLRHTASAPLHAVNYSLADANYSLTDANYTLADVSAAHGQRFAACAVGPAQTTIHTSALLYKRSMPISERQKIKHTSEKAEAGQMPTNAAMVGRTEAWKKERRSRYHPCIKTSPYLHEAASYQPFCMKRPPSIGSTR